MRQEKITSENIQSLKAQHGLKAVYIVNFNDAIKHDSPIHILGEPYAENTDFDEDYPSLDFVFKKVGFDVLSASAAMGQDNPIKAIKMQMESCLIWGDRELLFDPKDATVFTSVMQEFVKITAQRSASLKKN